MFNKYISNIFCLKNRTLEQILKQIVLDFEKIVTFLKKVVIAAIRHSESYCVHMLLYQGINTIKRNLCFHFFFGNHRG